jgi:hypothetical protein
MSTRAWDKIEETRKRRIRSRTVCTASMAAPPSLAASTPLRHHVHGRRPLQQVLTTRASQRQVTAAPCQRIGSCERQRLWRLRGGGSEEATARAASGSGRPGRAGDQGVKWERETRAAGDGDGKE